MTHLIIAQNEQAFRHLAQLGRDEREQLLTTIATARPALQRTRFTARVADESEIPFEEIERIISLLCQAYATADHVGLDAGELTADVRPPLEEWMQREEIDEAALPEVLEFLEQAVGLHGSVGVTAKAADLWYEEERVYCSSRTVTDLRPIFQPMLKGEPSCFLPIHTLRLTFHPGGEQRTEDVRVSLTFGDILQLKDLLERAISKEEQLVKLAEEDGIEILSDASTGGVET